ncbi:unnamed protein product [Paramecium sonneborni]|uniref:Transmembrane protein n=1 Tax=Paramecium sonneborni TaxID=65129 RepID=A0A8S1PLQ0_9CILI|nr:unnamed protein product [Paramecium sonneborni]
MLIKQSHLQQLVQMRKTQNYDQNFIQKKRREVIILDSKDHTLSIRKQIVIYENKILIDIGYYPVINIIITLLVVQLQFYSYSSYIKISYFFFQLMRNILYMAEQNNILGCILLSTIMQNKYNMQIHTCLYKINYLSLSLFNNYRNQMIVQE